MHSALRQATTDIHARIDALVSGGFADDASGYTCYLRGMHAFLDTAVAVLPDRDDWRDLRAALVTDLDVVGAPLLAGTDVPAARDAAERAGWDYVVGGAALGARVLLRDARRLGWDDGRGASFLAGHVRAGAQWPALLQRLASMPGADDPMFVDTACRAARDAFHHAEAALVAACENS